MKKFYFFLIIGFLSQMTAFGQEVAQEQQVVISKIGATWCPNCGLSAWDNFTTIHDEFDGQAVILSLHPSRSSRLHAPEAIDLSENLPQAFGQPLFYVNRTKYATGSIVQNTGVAVENAKNATPLANTGITATIKNGQLEVDAKVKFFQEGNGDYFLSLLVVEDGVVEIQSQRGSDAIHKKLLRTSLLGGTFGQMIGSGTIPADSEFTFSDTKEMEADWDRDNLEVAAIIWQKVDNNYEFVNAYSVDASFSTAVNFLEKSGVDLTIAPTLLKTSATVSLASPIQLDQVDIAIFAANGQQIKTLYAGNIAQGKQTFTIQRADLPASGVYFLRMESKGSVLSRKLVVE